MCVEVKDRMERSEKVFKPGLQGFLRTSTFNIIVDNDGSGILCERPQYCD